jgi:hypothetical protein
LFEPVDNFRASYATNAWSMVISVVREGMSPRVALEMGVALLLLTMHACHMMSIRIQTDRVFARWVRHEIRRCSRRITIGTTVWHAILQVQKKGLLLEAAPTVK